MTTQEQKLAYNKMLKINKTYNSLETLENKEYRGWLKQINLLKIDLCDSIYWDELINTIDFVKSKISY